MSNVSIIIPCYNLGEFLPVAVESALNQSVPPREVIVVDDGSTDEATRVVLASLARQGIQVLHKENGGASSTRNYGIERAQGPLILCLDADDILLPTYLEEVEPVLAANDELGLVTPYVEFFGETVGVWETFDYDVPELLRENCIASASLFRKQCWREAGGYPALPAFEDWDYWISIIEAGWKWTVVRQPLYRYRVRPQSISSVGRANRGQLIATIVDRHAEIYRRHMPEVLVRADRELKAVRDKLNSRRRDNAIHTNLMTEIQALLTSDSSLA